MSAIRGATARTSRGRRLRAPQKECTRCIRPKQGENRANKTSEPLILPTHSRTMVKLFVASNKKFIHMRVSADAVKILAKILGNIGISLIEGAKRISSRSKRVTLDREDLITARDLLGLPNTSISPIEGSIGEKSYTHINLVTIAEVKRILREGGVKRSTESSKRFISLLLVKYAAMIIKEACMSTLSHLTRRGTRKTISMDDIESSYRQIFIVHARSSH